MPPIDINVYNHATPGVGGTSTADTRTIITKLNQILSMLTHLTQQEVLMSAELDALEAQVTRNTTVNQSAVVLIQGIAKQLKDAGQDPAKIRELQTSLTSSAQALAEAITANTPSDPTGGTGTGGGGTGGPGGTGGTGGGFTDPSNPDASSRGGTTYDPLNPNAPSGGYTDPSNPTRTGPGYTDPSNPTRTGPGYTDPSNPNNPSDPSVPPGSPLPTSRP